MAWTPIKTWKVHDKLLYTDINNYLRGNLLESELEKLTAAKSFVGVAGQNSLHPIATDSVTSTASFTTTSTTPVAIAAPTVSVTHTGSFMVWVTCHMACSASNFGSIELRVSSGEFGSSVGRAVRTQSSLTSSYTMEYIAVQIRTSPVTLQLYGYTDLGTGTLDSSRRTITVMPL